LQFGTLPSFGADPLVFGGTSPPPNFVDISTIFLDA
jgi:hypothetical protein